MPTEMDSKMKDNQRGNSQETKVEKPIIGVIPPTQKHMLETPAASAVPTKKEETMVEAIAGTSTTVPTLDPILNQLNR